jgi:phage major head subunit gpT-like protein
MAAISRAQMLKQLLPGLNALFGLEYKTYTEEHKEIFEIESSEKSFEEEVKLSGFGAAPVKAEGASMAYDTAQEAFTSRYVHETIAMGFSISEEAMEDGLYANLAARYTKALARAMAHTKQIKAAGVLNNGYSSSFLGGDGQPLLSTAHPLVGGGVNSNRATTAVDLNETSLENALVQISGWTDERGLLIAARGVKLVVPPSLQFTATRLLKSTQRTGTSDNDVSAMAHMNSLPGGYTVNHFLTDPARFYIKTDVPNGLKMFQRTEMQTGSDGDFDTGNMRYRARERYSLAWSDPLGIWGSGT